MKEKSEEYIVNGAKMTCSFGGKESELIVPTDRSCYLRGKRAANASDITPDCNLVFGSCKEGGNCHTAIKMHWQDVKENFVIDNYPAVLKTASWTRCESGGIIRFNHSGQDDGEEENDKQEWEVIEIRNTGN